MQSNHIISLTIKSIWVLLIIFGLLTYIFPEKIAGIPGQIIDKTDELMGLAANDLSQGKLTSAAGKFELILNTDPSATEAAVELARIFTDRGNKQKAFKVIEKSIEQNPEKAFMCHYFLAGLFINEGQAAKAVQHLKEAYKTEPFSWTVFEKLADIYTRADDQKQLQAALYMYIDAKTNYQGIVLSGLKRDLIYSKGNDKEKINKLIIHPENIMPERFDRKIFETSVRRDKSIAMAYLQLYYSHIKTGEYESARQSLISALKFWPEMQEALTRYKEMQP